MNARVSSFVCLFGALLWCTIGVTGCQGSRTASLTVEPAQAVRAGAPVQVCYELPAGTQAAFIAPSLSGEAGLHDVTDTPSACEMISARRTTTYTLQIVPEQGAAINLRATLAVLAPPQKPTAKVTAVETVPNGGLCPKSIDVRAGIALLHGGTVTYYILLNAKPVGAYRRVTIPASGNASVSEELPFPERTKASAAIAITAPGRYVSPTLAFSLPCVIVPPAQVAIWKRASEVRCKPHSGFIGSGCARTVNQVIAVALGHSIPPGAPPFYCGGLRSPGQPWDPEARHVCASVWVPDIVQMIETYPQFGRPLERDETVPGDIAVQDGTNPQRGMNHIGFCEDIGCHFVLSNQSSNGLLCGHTNATMSNNGYEYPPYYPPAFYRVYGVTAAIK